MAYMKPDAIAVFAGGIKQDAHGRWVSTDLTEEDDKLGAPGGKLRIHAATVLATAYPASIVVLCGGKGYDVPKDIPEDRPLCAEILRDELIECGIPESRLMLEKNSNTTFQQLQELEKLIQKREWKRVMIITNRYNLPRLRIAIEKKFSQLAGVAEPVSAEEVLIEDNTVRWKKMIDEAYDSAFMAERIAKEERGASQTRAFSIGNRRIGEGCPCFIIAEISGNHHQKYEEAEQLVRAAKNAGADAVKLQTYTADTITLNSDKEYFRVSGKDQPDSWKGETLYNLYTAAYTPWEWQPKLKKVADEIGILLFSSPFDDTAVDFLEKEVGVDFYKIASYEAVHIPLLRKVASMRKPVFISIGFADKEEATLAIETLKSNGASDIVVMHCVTAYSDTPKLSDMNLATIGDIRTSFGVGAGFSDNNAGIVAPIIAAVAHKAAAVEKHITLSRGLGGHDARFSLEPDELREMIARIRRGEKEGIEAALEDIGTITDVTSANGVVNYGSASPQESENRIFRPSIWTKEDVKRGERLTTRNIRVARPGYGLAPKFFDEILGKCAAQDISFATPLAWTLVEGGQPK